MEKKKRITFYTDLNGPHTDQIRKNVFMTPEERWETYQRLKRRHNRLFGKPPKRAQRISLERPVWI